MADRTILLDIADGIARITLNRPEAANGLTLPMTQELLQAAIRCDEDASVRAIVVTGAGRMFCAGGDLKSFAGYGEDVGAKLKEMTTYLHGAISRLARGNAPVIAAVNGTAAGAGMSLAAACDLAIAAESAKFTMAYTGAGLSPDGSSTFFLPRLVGLRRTQELMLTNRRLTSAEALDWGLVNRVVPDEEVLSHANELAATLASGATRAYGTVKKLLTATFSEGLEAQMDAESVGIAAASNTADGKEGIAAFTAKRAPEFTGQ